MKAGVLFFTQNGACTAQTLLQAGDINFILFEKERESAKEFTRRCFAGCDAIVFIGAAGIAVRMIAPLIKAKDTDPAVLVIDEKGRFVIPVLSGHIGGANALAIRLATLLHATPVITTATDVNGVFAVDVWATQNGCAIPDTQHIKAVSAALLAGQNAGVQSDFGICGTLPMGVLADISLETGFCVTLDEHKKPFQRTLTVVPKIVTLGVGCRRDTQSGVFEAFVLQAARQARVSLCSVEKLATIDLKKDERCIRDFCEKYGLPLVTFSAQELASVSGDFTPSDFVRKTVGVDNVCERAAVAASGGELFVRKQAGGGVTAALAKKYWRCEF